MSFEKSNQIGLIGEKRVIQLFHKYGIEVVKSDTYAHDLVIKWRPSKSYLLNKNILAEVKYDVMSDRTGNIAVEFHNTNLDQPSGVASTPAEFWFIVTKDEIWMAPVEQFRKLLSYLHPVKILHHVGDGNASIMLFKKSEICNNVVFIELTKLNRQDFLETIQNRIKYEY